MDKIHAMHLFDEGYEKLRERIFENQQKLGGHRNLRASRPLLRSARAADAHLISRTYLGDEGNTYVLRVDRLPRHPPLGAIK